MLEYFQIIFVIQVISILILIKEYKNPQNVLILLTIYAYHLFFSYLYYSVPTDAQSMYQEGLDISLSTLPSLGNEVVIYIARICNEYLHLSYLAATILFASLSYIGIWMLFKLIQNYKIKYLWLILLIPSIHFWTAGFGKDCLVFFFISTLLYSVQKNKFFYIIIALIGIYLLRPHIGALFGLVFVIALLFGSNASFRFKIIATLAAGGAALATTSYLLSFLGIHSLSELYGFALMMQGQNRFGGSSYDVSEYNTFLQVFTYLFRPFFESLSLTSLAVSIDNLIYFSIFLWVIINIKFTSFKDSVMLFLILSFCIFSLIMGFTIANLGLAIRQKIMIMPFLLLIFIKLMARKREMVN